MPNRPTREELIEILNNRIENLPDDCWSRFNSVWKFWRKLKDAEGFRGIIRHGESTESPTPDQSRDTSC